MEEVFIVASLLRPVSALPPARRNSNSAMNLAIRQIDAGMSLSELTAFTAETWGCSRRDAREFVAKAHKDWLDACYGSEEIDQRDLFSGRWHD